MPDRGLAGRRVLVVEDEYLIATSVALAFEDAGAEVIGPAPSVGQAMALIEGQPDIHIGLLDVNLGGELVYPVADALGDRGVPFMFVTGYDAPAIPSKYEDVPRLEKPIPADDVLRAVSRSINSHGT